MMRCQYPDCGWHAVAPSERAAQAQYERHILDEHVREVAADLPEGCVQVRYGEDDEWRTVPREDARRLHEEVHGAREDDR